MRSKALKSSQDKSAAARSCIAKYNACANMCSGYADTYSDGDNVSTFQSLAAACQALSSKADDLNSASSTSISASDSGLSCMNNASDGSGSGGGSGDSSKDAKTAADKMNEQCTANPQAEGCTAAAKQYAEALKGVGQFGQADASKGQFDVTDSSGVTANPAGALGAVGGAAGAPAKVGTVPNNSGGGVGGGGGSSVSGGGGAAPMGPIAQALSAIADIEKGLFGGGGAAAAPPANTDEQTVTDTILGMLPGAGSRQPASTALRTDADLKKYLPQLNTIPADIRDQFHGPGVDLFSRVSQRMILRCKLGELLGCENGVP